MSFARTATSSKGSGVNALPGDVKPGIILPSVKAGAEIQANSHVPSNFSHEEPSSASKSLDGGIKADSPPKSRPMSMAIGVSVIPKGTVLGPALLKKSSSNQSSKGEPAASKQTPIETQSSSDIKAKFPSSKPSEASFTKTVKPVEPSVPVTEPAVSTDVAASTTEPVADSKPAASKWKPATKLPEPATKSTPAFLKPSAKPVEPSVPVAEPTVSTDVAASTTEPVADSKPAASKWKPATKLPEPATKSTPGFLKPSAKPVEPSVPVAEPTVSTDVVSSTTEPVADSKPAASKWKPATKLPEPATKSTPGFLKPSAKPVEPSVPVTAVSDPVDSSVGVPLKVTTPVTHLNTSPRGADDKMPSEVHMHDVSASNATSSPHKALSSANISAFPRRAPPSKPVPEAENHSDEPAVDSARPKSPPKSSPQTETTHTRSPVLSPPPRTGVAGGVSVFPRGTVTKKPSQDGDKPSEDPAVNTDRKKSPPRRSSPPAIRAENTTTAEAQSEASPPKDSSSKSSPPRGVAGGVSVFPRGTVTRKPSQDGDKPSDDPTVNTVESTTIAEAQPEASPPKDSSSKSSPPRGVAGGVSVFPRGTVTRKPSQDVDKPSDDPASNTVRPKSPPKANPILPRLPSKNLDSPVDNSQSDPPRKARPMSMAIGVPIFPRGAVPFQKQTSKDFAEAGTEKSSPLSKAPSLPERAPSLKKIVAEEPANTTENSATETVTARPKIAGLAKMLGNIPMQGMMTPGGSRIAMSTRITKKDMDEILLNESKKVEESRDLTHVATTRATVTKKRRPPSKRIEIGSMESLVVTPIDGHDRSKSVGKTPISSPRLESLAEEDGEEA